MEDIASPAPQWARAPSAGMILITPRPGSPHTPGGRAAPSPQSSPRRRALSGGAATSAGNGPAPAALSSVLLGRMQAELQAELMRLQEETQQLIEGCAAGDFSTGADAVSGSTIASSVRALSRRLGWVRSDLSLLRQMATSREHGHEVITHMLKLVMDRVLPLLHLAFNPLPHCRSHVQRAMVPHVAGDGVVAFQHLEDRIVEGRVSVQRSNF